METMLEHLPGSGELNLSELSPCCLDAPAGTSGAPRTITPGAPSDPFHVADHDQREKHLAESLHLPSRRGPLVSAALALASQALEPLDILAKRSRRLAQVVESSSRRRDCRDFRARLLILVLEFACPLRSRPGRAWYVPGAAARLGPEGLRRAWTGFFGETPRCLRSFRSHLGALENALAIVRSPGDWIPRRPDPQHPERRPRYPDTIHVLEDDLAASWWEGEGERLRTENPRAAYSPAEWRQVFGSWRAEAARGDLDLLQIADRVAAPAALRPKKNTAPELLGDVLSRFSGAPRPAAPPAPLPRRNQAQEAAGLIIGTLARREGPWALMRALELSGAGLRGTPRAQAMADPARFEGAAALLAVALLRDDGSPRRRVRSRPGWLVRAFQTASDEELERELARVRREQP